MLFSLYFFYCAYEISSRKSSGQHYLLVKEISFPARREFEQ